MVVARKSRREVRRPVPKLGVPRDSGLYGRGLINASADSVGPATLPRHDTRPPVPQPHRRGLVNRQQQDVIDYLTAENRVLRQTLE